MSNPPCPAAVAIAVAIVVAIVVVVVAPAAPADVVVVVGQSLCRRVPGHLSRNQSDPRIKKTETKSYNQMNQLELKDQIRKGESSS